MSKRPINPDDLAKPQGFAHAWLVESSAQNTLYLAGQCGCDREGRIASPGDLVAQLDLAMSNIVCILRDADMVFSDVVQLNFFVRSRNDYATARREFGKVWRKHSDRHFPAMAMFRVEGLYEPEALIEIQGIACSESS